MEDSKTLWYNELIELSRDANFFTSAWEMISWDTWTGLPSGGRKQRTELEGFLGKIWHRMLSDPKIGELLERVQKKSTYDAYDEIQKRNIFLIKRDYERSTCLPEDFVVRYLKQRRITSIKREHAIKKQDWKVFEPEFSKMFEYSVEYADYLKDVVGVSNPYDALLDGFEEGMRVDKISEIFSDVTKHVVPMVSEYAPMCENVRRDFLSRPIGKETQMKIIEELAEFAGYDTKSENAIGKYGETLHPMLFGRYDDVRIALRYIEDDFLFSSMAFIHECGHALYRINLNREWMFQPVGNSGGFGIDESQSKFLENVIGRSPEFLEFFLPRLNKITGNLFSDVTPIDFVKAANVVKPSPIRVNSDELTFSLHVIIRFEIEKDLFAGRIDIVDIPDVWNNLYEKYLGIEVTNDAEGALQDMHWGVGQFGHFPCYTLGNIFVSQLVEKMTEEIPNWKEQMRKGNVQSAIAWMSENVHTVGCLYDAPGLIEHVAGKKISAKPFMNYLTTKYKTLFG